MLANGMLTVTWTQKKFKTYRKVTRTRRKARYEMGAEKVLSLSCKLR
jgi:hypothetical protein